MAAPDFPTLERTARAYAARRYGRGDPAGLRLVVEFFADGTAAERLEVVPLGAPGTGAEPPPFVPTPRQKAILAALAGKGLRTDALAAALHCHSSRLYKPGGLPELQGRGLVGHHPRLGYYSTAAPPPELAPAGGRAEP